MSSDSAKTRPAADASDPMVMDAVSTGAAADSAEPDERINKLPRLFRYAILSDSIDHSVEARLVAEIEQLCPDLDETATWMAAVEHMHQGAGKTADAARLGVGLAATLDRRAAKRDAPELRNLADCVRLLCLPLPRDEHDLSDHKRVAKALQQSFYHLPRETGADDMVRLERLTFGWAALPCCTDMVPVRHRAVMTAAILGRRMSETQVAAERAEIWEQARKNAEDNRRLEEEERKSEKSEGHPAKDESKDRPSIPEHHVLVAALSDAQLQNYRVKEMLKQFGGAVNIPLPLVMAPQLQDVRRQLLFEFPYAGEVIDFVLGDLVGRTTVHLRPLLLVGEPGASKSRFARRLGDLHGIATWRTDASRSDGSVFAGADRRWSTAEPCHPFMAIAQARHANPLVLLDEIEKAGTRTDYGRLWDCLLGFLEPETAQRYPDPALQVDLDLSAVSYVATANSLDPLPPPLRDRFRIITFPKPAASDLDALLPAVIVDLAKERNLDGRWISPLDNAEYAAAVSNWRGGSVRRLRRIVEVILRERDLRATRN